MRGDKQDNMVESDDYVDPAHGIPVWSLYGATRRPTDAMLDGVDVVLVDLQDLGCRIYTFVTTLRYVLEEAGRRGKAVCVLDRPNPAAVRSKGLRLASGLGELRRRRTAADAARPHHGRARALVRRDLRDRRRAGGDPDARLGARTRRRATAGRSTSCRG